MSSAIPYLFKEGSLPFQFDRGGQSIDGFVCTMSVQIKPGGTVFLSRVIEPTGDEWTGYLTSGETFTLPPGVYRIIGILVSTSTAEQQTLPTRFQVVAAYG